MRDAVAIAGLLLLSGGCSWAYPPLGLIVAGAVLLAAALCGHLREGAIPPGPPLPPGTPPMETPPGPY
jgi:hypothetical protein